jgi:hypothetical protein
VQGRLRRQLPRLESSEWLGGSVVMRCVLLPVPWSGSEDLMCFSGFRLRGCRGRDICFINKNDFGKEVRGL